MDQRIGVGVISLGWMGRLHTRSYKALAERYPELGIGCDLENKAIAYYRDHAARTDDPDLKQLFTWLLEWEDGHLTQLLELEKIYQDAYWADQGFSPM